MGVGERLFLLGLGEGEVLGIGVKGDELEDRDFEMEGGVVNQFFEVVKEGHSLHSLVPLVGL